jgi:hypothetical protein
MAELNVGWPRAAPGTHDQSEPLRQAQGETAGGATPLNAGRGAVEHSKAGIYVDTPCIRVRREGDLLA